MGAMTAIKNQASRALSDIFPGYFPAAKHDIYKDFGYPEQVTFDLSYAMYCRNGLAKAAVEETILKSWETNPEIWETTKAKESKLESDIRQRFSDVRIWQALAEADRRSMVGGYSGAVLRLADSKRFVEPVDTVPGGLMGLVEVIPAWSGQLTVSEWDTDERSPNYGQPKMFSFNEALIGKAQTVGQQRQFLVHPDRVIVWSADGTIHSRSALEPGFNSLLAMEKIEGAGGEGFWKNAKASPVLSIENATDLNSMAQAMGVHATDVADEMHGAVERYNKGFDAMLLLQGIKATTLGITLPSPEHFFAIALQSFCASLGIPQKIMVGNQNGERASTEDKAAWNAKGNARRNNVLRPLLMEFINRLERFGIIPERDWHLNWADLTESSMGEKIERAVKMAEISAKTAGYNEPTYTTDELRAVTGHDAIDMTVFEGGEE